MKFLGSLSTRDRVGLITVPRGSILVDLTRDHEEVRTALRTIAGQAPQTLGQGLPATARMPAVSAATLATQDRACSSRWALEAIAGMLNGMRYEEPKTIVFLSSGLTPPTRDAAINAAPGQCEIKAQHYEDVATAARAARAHFYIIQPNDIVQDPAATSLTDVTASRFTNADEALAGLENLAGVTGGDFVRLTGSADPVFARVASESAGYYIADFVPDPDERNGLAHRVEVRVANPDVKVRHRPQLFIEKLEGRKDPKFLTPQDMLRGSRRFRTLPLRAVAFASRNPDGADLRVIGVAEPMDPSVRVTSAAMALIDAKNRLVRQWSAEKSDLAGSTLIAAFPVSPGAYRLRVAAIDSAGRHGTVEYAFDAELTNAGPVKLSAIALGVSADGGFQPKLVFGNEPAAVAYLEMYGSSPAPVVRLELAESIDGPAVVSVPATLRETQTPDVRIAVGAIPLGGVFPGDYLVRVVVTNDGRPLGRATRTLRKIAVGGS